LTGLTRQFFRHIKLAGLLKRKLLVTTAEGLSTGQMPSLTLNQQHQSTDSNVKSKSADNLPFHFHAVYYGFSNTARAAASTTVTETFSKQNDSATIQRSEER